MGIFGCRVLTIAKPNVITQVMNMNDQSLRLSAGENFGKFNFTKGNPIVISSVLGEGDFAQCLQQDDNSEIDEPIEYENPDEKKFLYVSS